MSILIKGMEMPKSCEECDLIDDVEGMCLALYATTRKNFPKWGFVPNCLKNERQAWCPLIEIPPHGDLIDRDIVYGFAEKLDGNEFLTVSGMSFAFLKAKINDAPTVIEAEGREHGTDD